MYLEKCMRNILEGGCCHLTKNHENVSNNSYIAEDNNSNNKKGKTRKKKEKKEEKFNEQTTDFDT